MRIAFSLLVLFAAGCGGGDESPAAMQGSLQPTAEPGQVIHVYSQGGRGKMPEVIIEGEKPEAPKWPVALSEDPTLTIEDPYGRKVGTFDLSPVIGRGYAELKVTLTARKLGETSPPEPVRPVCAEDRRCVYRLSKPYVVALSDDSVVKLVARGDSVTLVARTLKLDAPATVDIAFSEGEREISRKKVTLLADFWRGRPM